MESPHFFFFIWTRVPDHNWFVEIKQFFKVDIKQNNISTVILLNKFLVYQWDPRLLQGSRVVYIMNCILMYFKTEYVAHNIFFSKNFACPFSTENSELSFLEILRRVYFYHRPPHRYEMKVQLISYVEVLDNVLYWSS